MIVIILYSVFILLACIEAIIRARYENLVYKYGDDANLHPLYFVVRGIIISIMAGLLWWYELPLVLSVIFFIACAISHPFFFDGILYTRRNKLAPEIYKKKFFDKRAANPDKNKSFIELEFWVRASLFIFSIFLIYAILND